AGDLVCIFPEGGLTTDGEVADFRPGVQKIIERTPVPVVPLALQGLWGSLFTRHKAPGLRRLKRGIFASIGLRVGAIVPATEATPELLRAQVIALRGNHK
ncbi:MAG: 1-acyl-sn-glycerol-3-phosphate acyltransferase, partial [Burkholderiaceae bacterium]